MLHFSVIFNNDEHACNLYKATNQKISYEYTNFIPGKAEPHKDKEGFGPQQSWLVCQDEGQLFHGSTEVLTPLTVN